MINLLLQSGIKYDENNPLGFMSMIAAIAHAKDKDKGGVAYIIHAMTVCLGVEKTGDDHEDLMTQCVAVAHDVIEDTPITIEDLREMDVPDEILYPLSLMEHKKKEGQSYRDYVVCLSQHPRSKRTKKSDLTTNSNILRLMGISDKDNERIVKYHAAWMYLNGKNTGY